MTNFRIEALSLGLFWKCFFNVNRNDEKENQLSKLCTMIMHHTDVIVSIWNKVLSLRKEKGTLNELLKTVNFTTIHYIFRKSKHLVISFLCILKELHWIPHFLHKI